MGTQKRIDSSLFDSLSTDGRVRKQDLIECNLIEMCNFI